MLARVVEVQNEALAPAPLASRARRLEVQDEARQPPHRARDATDLGDPLLFAIARAERANIRTLATAEQNLATTVLRMRLVDAMKR